MKNAKKLMEDKQYGLDVMTRVADSLTKQVNEIQKDLHYLHEWIRVTKQDNVTLSDIKEYKPR